MSLRSVNLGIRLPADLRAPQLEFSGLELDARLNDWPLRLRTSSSHEEGCERDWAVVTKRAVADGGKVKAIVCARTEWVKDGNGRMQMKEVEGSEFELKADLVLLAMGFTGPVVPGLVTQTKANLDPRGNVAANTMDYKT